MRFHARLFFAAIGVVTCQRLTDSCQPEERVPPDWPLGFGTLLRFPFDLADMKDLKQLGNALWQPDGSAADISQDVTDRGFRQLKGVRCVSELVGVTPVGGPGVRWTRQLWEDAQDWCLAVDNCTGIMLFVGEDELHRHHWSGRPQFCDGVLVDQGLKQVPDWNLFVRAS